MWQTKLIASQRLIFFSRLFYLLLSFCSLFLFFKQPPHIYFLLSIILIYIEYRRSYRNLLSLSSNFAIYISLKQLYWSRQRWYIVRKPLFLRYLVIINVKSLKRGKSRTLFIANDCVTLSEWRSLNYFLQRVCEQF